MKWTILFLILNLFSAGFLFAQEEEENVPVENLEEALDKAMAPGEEEDNTFTSPETNTHSLVPPQDLETTRLYQTETLSRRNFDEKKWKEVLGEVNFEEERRKKQEKKAEEEDDVKASAPEITMPWSGPVLRFISYAVIISIVIVLVYFIIRNISMDIPIQRSSVESDLEKPVENIEVIDIESLLDKASREGNFKLAVRLYYLRLLKKLHGQGIISWKKDKTNHDYLMELFGRSVFFDEIRGLTLSYESVWYGDHSLKAEAFEDLASRFETIHQRIGTVAKQ